MNTNEIIKLFTNGSIVFEDIESKRLECDYGIQLVQKSKSRFDTRHNQSDKDWMVNQELGWGGSMSDEYPYRWDINSDASMVCYRNNFVEYIFFDLFKITLDEKFKIEKEIVIKEAEKVITNNIKKSL
jgi:hypothetical protein